MHRSSNAIFRILLLTVLFLGTSALASDSDVIQTSPNMVVYKHPLCFCCKKWIRYLQDNGLEVRAISRMDMRSVKTQWHLPKGMTSCHTAVWRQKYVFEGHIPVKYIQRFLRDPPAGAIGLIVPGMPLGSPGMHDGKSFEPYSIYLLLRGGDYRYYARVEAPEKE